MKHLSVFVMITNAIYMCCHFCSQIILMTRESDCYLINYK